MKREATSAQAHLELVDEEHHHLIKTVQSCEPGES